MQREKAKSEAATEAIGYVHGLIGLRFSPALTGTTEPVTERTPSVPADAAGSDRGPRGDELLQPFPGRPAAVPRRGSSGLRGPPAARLGAGRVGEQGGTGGRGAELASPRRAGAGPRPEPGPALTQGGRSSAPRAARRAAISSVSCSQAAMRARRCRCRASSRLRRSSSTCGRNSGHGGAAPPRAGPPPAPPAPTAGRPWGSPAASIPGRRRYGPRRHGNGDPDVRHRGGPEAALGC